jgi:UDP-N-acetylmuramoyl-L-alanyl-D-glutamate--2,6-diaminopimelate ligase
MIAARAQSSPAKNLRALAPGGDACMPADVEITDLTLDSRAVRPGAAFVALAGVHTHGITFARQAAEAGARAILWEPDAGLAAPALPPGVALVPIADLRLRLGEIADRFFDAPSRSVRVVGVTGTNGKTTTAHVIAAAAQRLGTEAAYAGTIGYGRISALKPATHTTPDCITVHRQLAELRGEGVRCLAMEVSSHALDQHRVDGVRFDTAVFTNLTHDHLDYHGTFDAYGAAKAQLFTWPGLRHAILNERDAFSQSLLSAVTATRVTSYERTLPSAARPDGALARHIFARKVSAGPAGLELDIDGSWGAFELRSRFIGEFNVENLLAALATLLGWDIPPADAVAALEHCKAPPGRMETLAAEGRPLVIVDYAHTPDALEKVLLAARRHCTGKLTCVFGCGGERDPHKRPLMGAIAERLADRVILTDDNPRGERGEHIIADILKGLAYPLRVQIERERAAAIAFAIDAAVPGDVVLIAGKGHEDYQIIGSERRHFSDHEVALAALNDGCTRP